MRQVASALVLLAACGGGGPTIKLEIGDCALAAIDRGDGWERLPEKARVDVEVSGPFALVSVCPGPLSGVLVDVQLATLDDLAGHAIDCAFADVDRPELEVRLDPSTAPEAMTRIAVGGEQAIVNAYDPELLDVRPGLTDRIAVEQYGPRFLVERDVEVDGPAEWLVDMERDGIPLEGQPVVVSPELAGAEIYTWTDIAMNRAELRIHGGDEPYDVLVLPADVLRPTDTQRVHVEHQITQLERRWFTATPRAAPIEVEFAAPLDRVSYDRENGVPRASWDDDRSWSHRRFVAVEADPNIIGGNRWTVTEHPDWTDVAGDGAAIGFPDLAAIPGFDPSWMHSDYAGQLYLSTDPDAPEVVGLQHFQAVSSP